MKIINLETAITDRGEPWPLKGIHYRMHPLNVPVITSAGIDCCVMSNNHVLDWGYVGLNDTIRHLSAANIKVSIPEFIYGEMFIINMLILSLFTYLTYIF